MTAAAARRGEPGEPRAIEGVAEGFSFPEFLDLRAATWEAVRSIAARVEVGMSEDVARRVARAVLDGLGLGRGWHRTLVRVGPNTTKTFHEPSERDVVLRDDDIFFVDIGPLRGAYEGDAGDTFVVGDDAEMARISVDVREVWSRTRDEWLARPTPGRALYEFALEMARGLGWELLLDLGGHRLSEFPHRAHFAGALADVEIAPAPGVWMLEIQLRHRTRPFGAFYEDLLLEDA